MCPSAHARAAVRARLNKRSMCIPCQCQGRCVGPHVHVKLDVCEAGGQPRAVPRRQVRQRLQRVLAVLACRRGRRASSSQHGRRSSSTAMHVPLPSACLHAHVVEPCRGMPALEHFQCPRQAAQWQTLGGCLAAILVSCLAESTQAQGLLLCMTTAADSIYACMPGSICMEVFIPARCCGAPRPSNPTLQTPCILH